MGPGQLKTYTSEQLAIILKQHENAVDTALVDRHGAFIPPPEDHPYVVNQAEECKTTLCPRCGRGGMGEEISWLSISGVLKGDIPPTTAVGYGFRALGGRPMADANIVKNLGLRDPNTGFLSGHMPKCQEISHIAPENINSRMQEGSGTVTCVQSTQTGDLSETIEGTTFLNMEDTDNPPVASGHKTPSNTSANTSNSDEDFIDLYTGSKDTLGNSTGEEDSKDMEGTLVCESISNEFQ